MAFGKLWDSHKYHLLLFVLAVLIITRFYFDPDLGWHMAIGNNFLAGHGVIYGDQFSWTMPGYVWGNYFFAFEILVAFLFNHIGFLPLVLLFGFLGASGVLLLLPIKITGAQVPVIFLGIVISATTLGVRPSMISFWLFCFVLFLLERRLFERKVFAILWFLLFALWVNFHQGFLAALFVFFLYAFLDFLVRRANKEKISWIPRTFCFAAACLGTLVTPFNLLIYKGVFMDLTGTKTWSGIAEWQPVASNFPVNLFLGVSGFVFGYMLFVSFKKIPQQWFIIGAFLFAFSFLAANMLIFFGAIFIFLAARYFDFKTKLKFEGFSRIPLVFSLAAVFLAFIFNYIFQIALTWNLQRRLVYDDYPVAAVAYMKKHNIRDRVFNDYKWGGYIDYFYPEMKVFIDGRMTGWRTKDGYLLSDIIDINFGRCAPLLKYNPKAAIVGSEYNEKCFSGFRKVYEDGVAKILVREN